MPQLTGYDKFIQQALKYGFSLWGTAKSGQKTSYRDGDDGDFEKGYPKAPPRFVDNGDGTITDNASGLMWVKDPVNDIGSPFDETRVWDDAIDECLGLDYAWHSDWRLPNIKELISIVDYKNFDPSIDTAFFPNTKSREYWTSTTMASYTAVTFYVYFTDGELKTYPKGYKFCYARPVRLGVPK